MLYFGFFFPLYMTIYLQISFPLALNHIDFFQYQLILFFDAIMYQLKKERNKIKSSYD